MSEPLLTSCVRDGVDSCSDDALCLLRLISKEASRVAMLALCTYTLILKDESGYGRVCGARLLRKANLQNLHIHVQLSGEGQTNKQGNSSLCGNVRDVSKGPEIGQGSCMANARNSAND